MNRYKWITYIAVALSMYDMKRRAIDFLLKQIGRLEEPRALSSTILSIGMMHYKLGEEKIACRYFLEGLAIVESMELAYAPEFLTMLQVIQRQEAPNVTEYWIQNFADRIEDHPKFKRTIRGLGITIIETKEV